MTLDDLWVVDKIIVALDAFAGRPTLAEPASDSENSAHLLQATAEDWLTRGW